MESKQNSYFYPEGITADFFKLSDKASPHREQALAELRNYCKKFGPNFLGYQSNNKLDFQKLGDFLDVALNNIGNSYATPDVEYPAFADGFFTLNCKWVERAVLDYFAKLWGLKPPRKGRGEPGWEDSYWGYVLSMGSTEGNLMALRSARDYLKGEHLLYERNKPTTVEAMGYFASEEPLPDPVLLYSDHSHYSIKKLAQLLKFKACIIETNKHGQIDLDKLEEKAKAFLDKKIPVAVSFNYGTTFTAAFDEVNKAIERIKKHAARNNMDKRKIIHKDTNGKEFECERKGYWFHVDGALGIGHVTYARKEFDGKKVLFQYPEFDFKLDIQSLVMSGHKWLGAPWPTGIYMTRNRYLLTNDVPAYVGSLDSTLAGSRSGIAPLFMWDWIARSTDRERNIEVQQQLANARYAVDKLKDWHAERAPGSIAVTFNQPSNWVLRKYSIPVNGERRAHILCMPHVTRKQIDDLVIDMSKPSLLKEDNNTSDLSGMNTGGW